jgi:excisionase family DNA binding protein
MLLTVDEVAERMRLRPATVYRLIRDGILGCVYLGRVIRVRESVLEALIAAGGWRRPSADTEHAA